MLRKINLEADPTNVCPLALRCIEWLQFVAKPDGKREAVVYFGQLKQPHTPEQERAAFERNLDSLCTAFFRVVKGFEPPTREALETAFEGWPDRDALVAYWEAQYRAISERVKRGVRFVVPNMPRRLHNQFTREEWVAKHLLSPKDQDRLREAIERRFLPEPPRKGARYAAASNAFKAKRKALVWRDAWGDVTDHRAAAEATILLNADEARDGLVAALRSLAEPDTLVKREVIAALEAGGSDKFRGYVYKVTFEDLKEANVERDSLLKASDRTIRRGKTRTQTVDKDGKTPRLATWGDVDDDGRSINYVAPKEKKESDDLRDERLDPEDATAEAQGTDLISLAERIAPAWAAHILGKQGYKEVAATFNLKNERAARRRVEKEWKDHLERLGFPLTLEPRGEDDPAAVKRAQRAKRAQANAEHQAWLESLGLRR